MQDIEGLQERAGHAKSDIAELIQRLRELADKWDPSHYTGEPTAGEQCARELRAAIGDAPYDPS